MAVGKSKQKKMDVRVDFTPMVDMMMLLITFFMLCTSLAKPQTMELSMPSNDKNLTDQDRTVTKESYTITIYCTADNQLYYVAGLIKPENPKCLVKTNWGAKGIRSVIINHTTEDGTTPTIDVMKAKQKLDAEKDDPNKKMPDSVYNQRLAQIKAGNIDGKRINTLTIIIKATDNATYKNLVDVLDEMNICSIGKYVIDKINDQDLKLLKANNVKL
ncbi:MAG: biopolymer transporter ExbD [Prevotella sp.]|nr:biopolymer transporter ExbD [Prevotella sp.]